MQPHGAGRRMAISEVSPRLFILISLVLKAGGIQIYLYLIDFNLISPLSLDITMAATHPHKACPHLCGGDDDGTV